MDEEELEPALKYLNVSSVEEIAPAIKSGKNVLIVAHGNSLRALVMELEGLTADEIVSVEIPTGNPLVYELDDNLKPLKKYYLKPVEEKK